ncbi:MAG: hypothetical protein KI793_30315 [Rivularia sp. (in: Bacteria)]|nr:hypothetical protein [Rivularia sp. MS3]
MYAVFPESAAEFDIKKSMHLMIKSILWDNADTTLARQAINLDTRYTQIAFLNYLIKAAFTQREIYKTRKILFNLKY